MSSIKKIILLLVIFVFASTTCAFCATAKKPAKTVKTVKKEVEITTKDARILKATINYINIDGVKKYPTVLLLHSLGYSSTEWGNLINDLNNAGYAVIAMDFRGHGKSTMDSGFKQKSWEYFTLKTYQKFPKDVELMLDEVQKQSKKVDMNNFAIVGADVGANTAVLVAKDLKKKPKTLVLISPASTFKGLYIPLALVDMGGVPVLSMVSKKDRYCLAEQQKLAKFSQGGFYAKNYPNGGMGMTMIKLNPTMSQDITKWIIRYLK